MPRVLPRRRHGARYLAVRSLTTYYLLAGDAEGLYVTGGVSIGFGRARFLLPK